MMNKIKDYILRIDVLTFLVGLIIVTLLTIIALAIIGIYFPMGEVYAVNTTT